MSKDFVITRSTPIISTPCDNDFYKLTMKAAVFKLYPEVMAEYMFTCRTPGIDFRPMLEEIRRQIDYCGDLRYVKPELTYIGILKNPRFSPAFVRFLESESWNPRDVETWCDDEGALNIRIMGPWLYTIDWEIFLLSIVSEVYTRYQMWRYDIQHIEWERVGYERMWENLKALSAPGLEQLMFTDFGTRRRATGEWHRVIVEWWMLHAPTHLLGTSNIHLARTFGIPVFGTHAHEWDQAHLAFTHPLNAKRMAMTRWMEAFDGDAGITLTDTFTTAHFIDVFCKMLANSYTGVRHDSGPWGLWTEEMLKHYESLSIDPMTKTLLYSDGLDFLTMPDIFRANVGRCRTGFGIGTKLTNDMITKSLQIVIKMVNCNGCPVLKISDNPAKTMCQFDYVREYMLRTFGQVA